MIMKANAVAPAPDLRQLPGNIVLVNPDEITAYLTQYSELVPILPDLCARTRAEFGNEAELRLELKHDFEIYDPHVVLTVRVRQQEPTTWLRVQAINEAFAERLTIVEGWLWVTTDQCQPGGDRGV